MELKPTGFIFSALKKNKKHRPRFQTAGVDHPPGSYKPSHFPLSARVHVSTGFNGELQPLKQWADYSCDNKAPA